MALKATAKAPGGGGNYEVPEAGNQPAVFVAIIDLGTHEDEYNGESYKSHKVQIVWELTTQKKSDTHNHLIGREYALSISAKSNLGKLISGLTGKTFSDGDEYDLTQLLGKPCLVNVIHGTSKKGNTYARVDGASRLPKGMTAPPAKRKPLLWEIDGNTELPENLDWLPFIIGESPLDVIRRSQEWKAKMASLRKDADEGHVDELADQPEEEEAPF